MLKKLVFMFFVVITSISFIAPAGSEWVFKEQDLKKAADQCKDGSPCKPELVPTKDADGCPNFALLEAAKPNTDSLLAGWCPDRHCTEYLNDGFYNNCRSWISAKPSGQEAWAEIDMGAVYRIKKVGIGSDHCGNYMDRAAKDFKILIAAQYNEDSKANSWKVVYDNKNGEPINTTTYFEFDEAEARYVRISVLSTNATEVRIDEIEIYSSGMAVDPQDKLTTYWGRIKIQ